MSKRIALLVANSTFSDERISQLYTPSPNVNRLHDVLLSSKVGRFDSVKVLEDQDNSTVMVEIGELTNRTSSGDTVLIYFAGHGILDDMGRLYLAVRNTRMEHPEPTSVRAQYITEQIDQSFANYIIILDCCYSGAFHRRGAQAVLGNSVHTRRVFGGNELRRVILTASDETSYAWEGDNIIEGEVKHSVFTRHLLAGLENGRADYNNTGQITVGDMYRYIKDEISRTNPIQKPQCYPYKDSDRDLVLAYNEHLTDLPQDHKFRVNHDDYMVRETAPRQLLDLYKHQLNLGNEELIPVIISSLEKLRTDPKESVREEATKYLGRIDQMQSSQPAVPVSQDTERVRVFISSPGDLKDERMIIRRIINTINDDPEIADRAFIEMVAYDENAHFPFYVTQTPQQTIDENLHQPKECDIVLVMFWTRMGTPLDPEKYGTKPDGTPYLSGTEREYYNALEGVAENDDSFPRIIVYRRESPPLPPSNWRDAQELSEQMRLVEEFFDTQFNNPDGSISGGINTYESPEEFEQTVTVHLRNELISILDRQPPSADVLDLKPTADEGDMLDPDIDLEEVEQAWTDWLIEQNQYLDVRGIDLQDADGKLRHIKLDNVFVALRGETEMPYERQRASDIIHDKASRRLKSELEERQLSTRETHKRYLQLLKEERAKGEQVMSLLDRDRPIQTPDDDNTSITLADAFRDERQLIILGDPGSGKTTLARWLTLNLARSWRERNSDEDKLRLSAHKIDPNLRPSTREMKRSLGPVRLPIILRISDYAERRIAHYNDHHLVLHLDEFLGHQSWFGHYPRDHNSLLTPEALNKLFMHHLASGTAVLILDGMDEVTETEQRRRIVKEIERLRDKMLTYNRDLSIKGKPEEVGGNQLIITSRIAGYYEQPITGDIKHVTIRPMSEQAIKKFCDTWMEAVYDTESSQSRAYHRETAKRRATHLKNVIFKDGNESIKELAQNPLLLTIIASIFYDRRGKLPSQRAQVYQMAMDSMFKVWKQSRHEFSLNENELFYILSPIAAHIHANYSTGLIVKRELKKLVYNLLAEYRYGTVHDSLPGAFTDEVEGFIRVIEEDVGLLAPRGHELYGFLHLTFQEYLAALHLADPRDIGKTVEEIIERANDPRWREPILLCFGHVGSQWATPDQTRLLEAILTQQETHTNLVPNLILLLAKAIPDMRNIQDQMFKRIVKQLLKVYADQVTLGYSDVVSDQAEAAIVTLRKSAKGDLVDRVFREILLRATQGQRSPLAPIVASIIKAQGWYTQELTMLLVQALSQDSRDHDFPIDTALRKVITPQSTEAQISPPSKGDNNRLDALSRSLERYKSGEARQQLVNKRQMVKSAYAQKLQERLDEYQQRLVEAQDGTMKQETLQQLEEVTASLEELEEEDDTEPQRPSGLPFSFSGDIRKRRLEREVRNLRTRLRDLETGKLVKTLEEQIETLQNDYASLMEEDQHG